jgi:hypothetical protein
MDDDRFINSKKKAAIRQKENGSVSQIKHSLSRYLVLEITQ